MLQAAIILQAKNWKLETISHPSNSPQLLFAQEDLLHLALQRKANCEAISASCVSVSLSFHTMNRGKS